MRRNVLFDKYRNILINIITNYNNTKTENKGRKIKCNNLFKKNFKCNNLFKKNFKCNNLFKKNFKCIIA